MGQALPSDPALRAATLRGTDIGLLGSRGLRRIFVLTGEGWQPREIRVGGEDQTHIEVMEGLAEGEEVIIGHAR